MPFRACQTGKASAVRSIFGYAGGQATTKIRNQITSSRAQSAAKEKAQ